MAEYQTKNLKIGVSKTPESAFNSRVPGFTSLNNNYMGILTTGRGFPMPDKEKFDDRGKVGGCGSGHPKEQHSGYVLPPTMEINEELSTDFVAQICRRTFGGDDTVPSGGDILVAGEVFRHKWVMQDPQTNSRGRQLPSSSVVYALGGADFVYSGVVGDSFRIEQAGAQNPMATMGLVGSGKYDRLRDLSNIASGGNTARPSVPCPVPQYYLQGAETYCEFTDVDGSGAARTIGLTANQRLKNFSYTLSNNIRTDDRRAGDSRINPATTKRGWFVKRLLFVDPTVAAEVTVTLDDNLWEWQDADQDIPLTNFLWRARGDYIKDANGADTAYQYEFGIEIPMCYLRSVRTGDDNGDATVTFGVFPTEESTTYGLSRIVVVNKVAGLIQ